MSHSEPIRLLETPKSLCEYIIVNVDINDEDNNDFIIIIIIISAIAFSM